MTDHTNADNHNDDLDAGRDASFLDALAAANPTTADLPQAGEPQARNVLAAAMRTSMSSTSSAAASDNQPASPFGAPPAAASKGSRARLTPATAAQKKRRWPMLAGVAAASAALIGGALVLLPNNTEPAIALVHEAASRTSDANTGRMVATFSVEGSEADLEASVVGEVTSVFAGEDFSLAIEINESSGAASDFVGSDLPISEARLVDGVIYVEQEDGAWFGIEAPEFLGSEVADLIDPRTVLTTVQELVETEEVGTATIDGVETTHYRSVTDIGEQSLTQTGWVAGLASQEGLDADGLVTIDLYVDDEGRLRQLDIVGDLEENGEGAGEATFTVQTQFLDLGADLEVTAPDGAEITSLFEGLAEIEGELGD